MGGCVQRHRHANLRGVDGWGGVQGCVEGSFGERVAGEWRERLAGECGGRVEGESGGRVAVISAPTGSPRHRLIV